ncbi:dicarboxylate/amino acid:cation symporter [Vagococcus bubulae]|uniref:Dicarboxylate/amino acid:cation symporter n=1 Tax=Vagococcus bubulae TaxID=1977868 RepID=A0A429ZGH6_9ENTE|nr:dicarboxylate/amino acid:cation symporter [Vagococcus bubulae]RST92818.1 dicarboxylate/amino acid:cation symporter [Vagococcus bubulae]
MTILRNYKSSFVLLGGMILGSIIGIIMGPKATMFMPLATIFLNLLYCCIVPMIFTSLVSAIANMESTKKLGKILSMMIGLFIITGIFAAIFMLLVTITFNPAKGVSLDLKETIDAGKASTDFVGMLTVNDFNLLWSRQNLMALIVFTILFGIATSSLGEKGIVIVQFFDGLSNVIIKLVGYVMKLAPIGLGAFFASLIGEQGSQIAGPLSRSLIIFLFASLVYYFVSNTLFAFIGGGREGISLFWKNILPPSLTSLGTCSSAATIPTNLIAGEKIGLSKEINNLVVPMGANLHKDGAVLIQILKIVFMCEVFNINILEPKNFITAIVIAVLASCVMGAIPAGGYTGEIFIMSAFGLPQVAMPIMILIGTITDAPATAINSTGDISVGMMLSRFIEGKDWYNKPKSVESTHISITPVKSPSVN